MWKVLALGCSSKVLSLGQSHTSCLSFSLFQKYVKTLYYLKKNRLIRVEMMLENHLNVSLKKKKKKAGATLVYCKFFFLQFHCFAENGLLLEKC